MVLIFILVIAAACWYVYHQKHSYADTDYVRQCIDEGRNELQIQALRFFCNDPGCLNKEVTDEEYEYILSTTLQQFNFKKMALDKIAMDEDELKEIDPVHFEGYVYDNAFIKEPIDFEVAPYSSKYQVSWLFFSTSQVFVYQCIINTDEDDIRESTEEYFYKDITSFSTASDTIEVDDTEVNVNRFTITVPGDKFYCSLEQSDYTEKAIQGMRSLLRDKKNNG